MNITCEIIWDRMHIAGRRVGDDIWYNPSLSEPLRKVCITILVICNIDIEFRTLDLYNPLRGPLYIYTIMAADILLPKPKVLKESKDIINKISPKKIKKDGYINKIFKIFGTPRNLTVFQLERIGII